MRIPLFFSFSFCLSRSSSLRCLFGAYIRDYDKPRKQKQVLLHKAKDKSVVPAVLKGMQQLKKSIRLSGIQG